jgi:hypothetical protein
MRKLALIIAVGLITLVSLLAGSTAGLRISHAQATPVEFGAVFQGTLMPNAPQASFAFKGKAGAWALVEFIMNESTFSRPPIFRVRLEADDLVNTSGVPGQTAESLMQLPKDAEYVLDILPPPGEEAGTFSARVSTPAMIGNGQTVQANAGPKPVWYMMFSNGPFSLLYTTQDAAGLSPLTVSGVIPSGKPTPGGYLKLVLTTDNTVGGNPDFGAVSSLNLTYAPKPAVAVYLIRVGSSKQGTPPFVLLRSDVKK